MGRHQACGHRAQRCRRNSTESHHSPSPDSCDRTSSSATSSESIGQSAATDQDWRSASACPCRTNNSCSSQAQDHAQCSSSFDAICYHSHWRRTFRSYATTSCAHKGQAKTKAKTCGYHQGAPCSQSADRRDERERLACLSQRAQETEVAQECHAFYAASRSCTGPCTKVCVSPFSLSIPCNNGLLLATTR